ncbi:MAG: extracellular solute-binding protein, partial [Lachnospiraceae bacterium]|nr:extracellular solute-binding protein [Lachnospiraceae bacterium]
IMEEYYNIEHVIVYNQDGTIAQNCDIQLAPGESSGYAYPDYRNAVIYMAVNKMDEDWNPIWWLKKFDMNGTELGAVQIEIDNSSYAYVQSVLLTTDDKIIIGMENDIKVYDTDLKLLGEISSENYLYSYFVSPNGGAYTSTDKELPNGDYTQVINEIDLDKMELGQEYEASNLQGFMDILSGVGTYDAVIRNASGIYVWNFAESSPKKLMGFVESDLDSNIFSEGFMLDENTAVFLKHNAETWSTEGIRVCKKVDPSTIEEKEIITLGMLYYDSSLAADVIAFNDKSENTRIQIKAYMDDNGEWEAAQKAFNNDLISGNCPDIVCISEATEQFYNYMEKGTFAPLDSYIKDDPEIDENDIFPNVKAALSSDGKMYAVTPSFYVMSMAMKEKYAPANGRITFDELIALEQQLGVNAFFDTINENVIYNLLTYGYDEYIDLRTGKCNFGDSFAKALEYSAQYPAEIEYDENMYMEYESIYRQDKAILSYAYISDFREFNRMEQGTFGEKVALVGFPGNEGRGAILCLGQICAISAKSKNKDVAWEFVREYMTTQYQEEIGYNFPTRISVCEKQMEEQMKKMTYTDMDGVEHEYDDTYYINGEEIVIHPISKERAEYVFDYISGIESVYFVNDQISNIVKEEAAPLFAGQKNSKQVVEIIQSRVQTYVNEGR